MIYDINLNYFDKIIKVFIIVVMIIDIHKYIQYNIYIYMYIIYIIYVYICIYIKLQYLNHYLQRLAAFIIMFFN